MRELFDRYPGEAIRGKDITIRRGHADMFISDRDEVFCCTGICLNEENALHRGLFARLFHMDGKYSTDKKIAG